MTRRRDIDAGAVERVEVFKDSPGLSYTRVFRLSERAVCVAWRCVDGDEEVAYRNTLDEARKAARCMRLLIRKDAGPLTVTLDGLRSMRACVKHRDIFEATFPNGCKVNARNVRKALAVGLDVEWWVWCADNPHALDVCADVCLTFPCAPLGLAYMVSRAKATRKGTLVRLLGHPVPEVGVTARGTLFTRGWAE